MISEKNFKKEWAEKVKQKHFKKKDPSLLERMTQALYLCEQLKTNGLEFVFKGGTSLILLFDEPQRFSIDIDVVTTTSRKQLENVLDNIIKNSHFTSWKPDEKRSYKEGGVPKAHYFFFFDSIFDQDNKILLDILFDKQPYLHTQSIKITKPWIDTTLPLTEVTVPTIESIAGDKLTAFAPSTTGILYETGKHTEIIKQMFDVGQLFDKIEDFELAVASFQYHVKKEIGYRNLSLIVTDVLDDILTTCFDVVMEGRPELNKGILTFKNWTIHSFRREEAIEAAGKIAYMAAKIKANDMNPLLHFDAKTMNKKDYWVLHEEYNRINKRVRNAKNAVFYWYHAVDIIIKHPQLFHIAI